MFALISAALIQMRDTTGFTVAIRDAIRVVVQTESDYHDQAFLGAASVGVAIGTISTNAGLSADARGATSWVAAAGDRAVAGTATGCAGAPRCPVITLSKVRQAGDTLVLTIGVIVPTNSRRQGSSASKTYDVIFARVGKVFVLRGLGRIGTT